MARNSTNQFTRNFMQQMGMNSNQDRTDDTQILAYLQQISADITRIADNASGPNTGSPPGGPAGSQSAARDARDANRNNSNRPFGQHHANFVWGGRSSDRDDTKSFLDAFEKSLLDSLGGSKFKDKLKSSLNKFADELGVDLEDLEGEVGDSFGRMFANNIKNSNVGSRITDTISNLADKIFGENNVSSFADMLKQMKNNPDLDFSFLRDNIASSLGEISPGLGEFAGGIGNALGVVDKFTAGIGGTVLVMAAVKLVGGQLTKAFQTISEGIDEFGEALSDASGKYYSSRQKQLDLENERRKQDMETLVREPFEILKKAADEVYDAWNANIRLIGQTQGYNKENLQDLMSAYAQRLQQEGLSNVIPATEVYNNLAKVLHAGLSGNSAVEFAYQATKYNAALPTQDFFNFVDSYTSVAANALAAGKSEAEALDMANASLASFSNSLLYASRELTGGYTTGLKNAESIYTESIKIAQAARSENQSQIASTLLAIQGYLGGVAPDLANTLTDKIYQLSTGGNSSDIVALRSLAGINASNTEFLQALANNPQAVLSNMFASLGRMFTESPDAYMEKAEGYASLFGLSQEAFQRIDFQALAQAIAEMNNNGEYLKENLQLLAEGQTTTSTDQLKIAQINKYMVEEGLAYVIDNEAAQMIQQHMWDEQIARQLMDAEYGVELIGSTKSFLNKIVTGIEFITNLLNPFAWGRAIADVVDSYQDAADISADVRQVLELSKIGNGNLVDLYNLTTRNADLNLTNDLVTLMGGVAKYNNRWYDKGVDGAIRRMLGGASHPLTTLSDTIGNLIHQAGYIGELGQALQNGLMGGANASLPSSNYSWGAISKSSAALASAALNMYNASSSLTQSAGVQVSHQEVANVNNMVSASAANAREKLAQMTQEDYLKSYAKQGYEAWAKSGAQFGITDMERALSDAGYNKESLQTYFDQQAVQEGMNEMATEAERLKNFQEAGTKFWNVRFWDDYEVPLTGRMSSIIGRVDSMIALQSNWRDVQFEKLDTIVEKQTNWHDYFDTAWLTGAWKTDFIGESGLFTTFFNEFVKKFVEHTYYDESGYTYADVTRVQRKEDAEKGDAVYALADVLTSNIVDLKDPQVQTNALLAQILQVVFAIMNQNNNVAGTMSLADALSGLAVGLTTNTPLTDNAYSRAARTI